MQKGATSTKHLYERVDCLSKTLRARQALFIVDACFSGIIGGFTDMSYENIDEIRRKECNGKMYGKTIRING